jgi:hypothetical protein
MGTARNLATRPETVKLVSVSTETLRDCLNGLYSAMKSRPEMLKQAGATPGLFDYLWDLKELALVEGRNEVEVPTNWLEEIEHEFVASYAAGNSIH